jgi:DNA polymerase-1
MFDIDISAYNNQIFPQFITLADLAKCDGHVVAVDTETTGLRWYENKIIGLSAFCPTANVWGYLPLEDNIVLNTCREILMWWNSKTVAIFHNAKFDLHFLGINPNIANFKVLDTAIMIHLYNSRLPKKMVKAEEYFLGTSSKREYIETPVRTKIWNWDIELIKKYASNDVLVTYQLAAKIMPELKELGLITLLKKDLQYLNVIWEAEREGMDIDFDFIERSCVILQKDEDRLAEELFDGCGQTFNWRSPQQLSKAIYEGLGIPKPKNPFADADGVDRSKLADKGLYKSTCTNTFLLTEKVHHPLGELIGALRESAKMRRYLEGYAELAQSDGKVHANFNITGTRTGRLSCSKPNLQNVPSMHRGRFTQKIHSGKTDVGDAYVLRKAFIAPEGRKFVGIDYKQMEMRMFGILSNDPFMLKSLDAGLDIHAEIAYRVWNVRDSKVHREWSKTIGFGLIYGMTIGSLMFKLNMSKGEAKKIRDQYLTEFPRVMPWMNEVIGKCRAFEHIRYWSGRLWREDDQTKMYKGANALIQGGCADLLSVVAIRSAKFCATASYDPRIISFIHDEIMYTVPEHAVDQAISDLSPIMQAHDIFHIPFLTSAKVGDNYGEMNEVSAVVEPELEVANV